jgi:hypothetical protein
MLTPVPNGDAFAQRIPEPSPFCKSATRAFLIQALNTFAAEPWRIDMLQQIPPKCLDMMSKHYHKGRKYQYLNDVMSCAEKRYREIDERIDRFSRKIKYGKDRPGIDQGRGMVGIYGFESQKHKTDIRQGGQDFTTSLLFGNFDEVETRFENAFIVQQALTSGDFGQVSRQDLYALKKLYKSESTHQLLGVTPSENVPYFNEQQRQRLLLSFDGESQHGYGARLWQGEDAYDTMTFGGGRNEAAQLALYACALDGSFYAVDGFKGTGEQVFQDLGLHDETMLNHSSILAGNLVVCAGWLRAYQGELTDINNGSGHYKPSARDLARAISMIGQANDLSRLRAAAVISDTHFYYFPAEELYAASENQLKSNWTDIGRKVILDRPTYRQIYRQNLGTSVSFDEIYETYREQTLQLELEGFTDPETEATMRLPKVSFDY